MSKYIALGTNLEPRQEHLNTAFRHLRANGIQILRTSSIYETPNLLQPASPQDWNKPYLNCVIEVDTRHAPHATLDLLKSIETGMGRDQNAPRHSPRIIDLDILLWDDLCLNTSNLTIPHAEMANRAFVLDPLSNLAPDLMIPQQRHSVLHLARAHKEHQPLIMGILNITEDSFSDGGLHRDMDYFKEKIRLWRDAHVPIFDLGAESTRPGAAPLTAAEEWIILAPYLEATCDLCQGDFAPKISLDSYHPETTARALKEYHIDIINDVSGLQDPRFFTCLQQHPSLDAAAMHSLTIPVDKSVNIPLGCDPIAYLKSWFSANLETWHAAGIPNHQLIFDPGIGFNKVATQSLEVIKRFQEFADLPVRLMCGHSRKSFMKLFNHDDAAQRDAETLAYSLDLRQKGVDILRVHDPLSHKKAIIAALHVA